MISMKKICLCLVLVAPFVSLKTSADEAAAQVAVQAATQAVKKAFRAPASFQYILPKLSLGIRAELDCSPLSDPECARRFCHDHPMLCH
jgi:hypothetical protein